MTFKIGDTVKLKSGGPRMTVQHIGDYSASGIKLGAQCVWFDGSKKLVDVFHVDALELYKPPSVGVVRSGRVIR